MMKKMGPVAGVCQKNVVAKIEKSGNGDGEESGKKLETRRENGFIDPRTGGQVKGTKSSADMQKAWEVSATDQPLENPWTHPCHPTAPNVHGRFCP